MKSSVPPHSLEAEMNTLAAVVYDSGTWPSVSQIVQSSDFYSRPHRQLFEALNRLFEEHDGVIDTHDIVEYLDKTDELEDVGGRRYLEELAFYMRINMKEIG